MAAHLQQHLDDILRKRRLATELENLIGGYSLFARTEGKNPSTITLTATALTFTELGDLVDMRG